MKLKALYEQDIEVPALAEPEAAPAPAPEPAPAEPAGAPPGEEQGTQAGYEGGDSGYDLEMIVGQLRGMTKPWVRIGSRFPEGEQRHSFMEIGERIAEIANTLERDFGIL